jgi:hypothetical protein
LSLFVQLESASGPGGSGEGFRVGFHRWVVDHGGEDSQAVILEVNEALIPDLAQLWGDVAGTQILLGTYASHSHDVSEATLFQTLGGDLNPPVVSWRRFVAEITDPNTCPAQVSIPMVSVDAIRSVVSTTEIDVAMLSLDSASRSASLFSVDDFRRFNAREISLTSGVEGAESKDVERRLREEIRTLGYRFSGTSWGPAGTTLKFTRATSVAQLVETAGGALRALAGQRVVDARESLPSLRGGVHSLSLKIGSWRRVNRSSTIDYGQQKSLVGIPLEAAIDLAEFLDAGDVSDDESYEPSFNLEHEQRRIDEEARDCHSRYGVWPISFSHPRLTVPDAHSIERAVSRVIPGAPYAFDDEDAYLDQYAKAAIGITHRKAGWDCFRHVEILAAGSVPLMPDIGAVPKFSMIHYPKEQLAVVASTAIGSRVLPGPSLRRSLHQYADRFLASDAMAAYMLRVTDLSDARSVLFLDQALTDLADYLSLTSLIGFKKLYGNQCIELPEIDYIYEDTSIETRCLYGRGFGYSRTTSRSARTPADLTNVSVREAITSFVPDVVVIGSIARNVDLGEEVAQMFPTSRTIWIHGEDFPPSDDEVEVLRNSGAHIFVRSIEPIGSPDRRSYSFHRSAQVW